MSMQPHAKPSADVLVSIVALSIAPDAVREGLREMLKRAPVSAERPCEMPKESAQSL